VAAPDEVEVAGDCYYRLANWRWAIDPGDGGGRAWGICANISAAGCQRI